MARATERCWSCRGAASDARGLGRDPLGRQRPQRARRGATCKKYDPDGTVPMTAGTFVVHYGKPVHFDGAKGTEAVIEIVGEGPATITPAEE